MSAMFPRWNLGALMGHRLLSFPLFLCYYSKGRLTQLPLLRDFSPLVTTLIAVPLHCTLKVLNWLPALCLHTGWVRLSGSAPLPGSGRFSSSPLMWPIAIVGGL